MNLKNIVVEESVMRASHFGNAVAARLGGTVFVLVEAFPSVCWHCYRWSEENWEGIEVRFRFSLSASQSFCGIQSNFIQQKWLVVSSRRKRKMEFFLENASSRAPNGVCIQGQLNTCSCTFTFSQSTLHIPLQTFNNQYITFIKYIELSSLKKNT